MILRKTTTGRVLQSVFLMRKRFGNIFAVRHTAPKIVRENYLFAETTTKQSRRKKRERIQNTDTIVCYHLVVVKQITRERAIYILYYMNDCSAMIVRAKDKA